MPVERGKAAGPKAEPKNAKARKPGCPSWFWTLSLHSKPGISALSSWCKVELLLTTRPRVVKRMPWCQNFFSTWEARKRNKATSYHSWPRRMKRSPLPQRLLEKGAPSNQMWDWVASSWPQCLGFGWWWKASKTSGLRPNRPRKPLWGSRGCWFDIGHHFFLHSCFLAAATPLFATCAASCLRCWWPSSHTGTANTSFRASSI